MPLFLCSAPHYLGEDDVVHVVVMLLGVWRPVHSFVIRKDDTTRHPPRW